MVEVELVVGQVLGVVAGQEGVRGRVIPTGLHVGESVPGGVLTLVAQG